MRHSVVMLAALAGLSFNCNNPSFCGNDLGGDWGWIEFDRSADGTQTWGDAESAFCFHSVGGGGAGAGHSSIEIESSFIAPGSAGPQTFFASGEETDSTSEILGFKAPPGVAIQIQVAFRPAK